MGKSLYIAEKPSVAQEFAKALKMDMRSYNGYREGEGAVVTWCVGHLVTMSYPEVYDMKYKKWSLATLPFIPQEFKYEVIKSASAQFQIVKGLLNREDIDTIYVCTDSGREGEYIYRLVEQMSGVKDKKRKRVWIDSQTEEEILRGIREAKDLSEYDNLADSAYLRAKEDYLMGINFSRLLTLKYGNAIASYLHEKYSVISVGRVMTCVLGMVVRREREIREFVKTPFYRVLAKLNLQGRKIDAEWRVNPDSVYFQSPKLYKENGFLKEETAKELIVSLENLPMHVEKVEKKKETKNIPVIMVTAKSTELDKVKGLDMGADDYLTKPFGVMELISRVKALLRRTERVAEADVIRCGCISLDNKKHAVKVNENVCELTFKEFELLRYMMLNEGIVLSRDKIMDQVWGFEYEGESRTVDMHIKTLRHKLGEAGALIKTVRNVGYMID